MISNKVIDDEAFCINLHVVLRLAAKNADISKNWLFTWNVFNHSKHYRLLNKCGKFQEKKTFVVCILARVGKFTLSMLQRFPKIAMHNKVKQKKKKEKKIDGQNTWYYPSKCSSPITAH